MSMMCEQTGDNVAKASIREEQLQILVECVSDMIARIDMAGRVLYASPSSMSLLGVSAASLCGRSIYEMIHDDDQDVVRHLLGNLIEAGEMSVCEYRLWRADGNLMWVEMRSQRAQAGGRDEIVAVLRDISDRRRDEIEKAEHRRHLELQIQERNRQLEISVDLLKKQIEEHKRDRAALEVSEVRYTTLVENTLTGIYIHDGHKMIFCNERFARIFGFNHDALEEVNIDDLFTGGRPFEGLLYDMKQVDVIEGTTCDGKRIWLKTSHAGMVCNDQNLLVGNVIDITEQIVTTERLKKSEQELHALSSQLMAAQEQERKRIANELHDGLGQRLSAIKFAVENVCRTADHDIPAVQSRHLESIIESIRDTIEEVRRVSMDLRPSILDDLGLIATIGWFCREFSLLFPAIAVHRNINTGEADIPEEVKVVIFRIIQEAFHNIAKHAEADQIVLELLTHNNALRLMICDNGRGISCIDQSLCTKGLGLKSMRERAELTHGEFHVESTAGKGTKISVQWPRQVS